MAIKECTSNIKKMHKLLLQYLENDGESEEEYKYLVKCFSKQTIANNYYELKISLLSKITKLNSDCFECCCSLSKIAIP